MVSHIIAPAISGLVLWILLELGVSEIMRTVLDDYAVRIVFKVVFGLVVGIPLAYWIIDRFGRMELLRDKEKG